MRARRKTSRRNRFKASIDTQGWLRSIQNSGQLPNLAFLVSDRQYLRQRIIGMFPYGNTPDSFYYVLVGVGGQVDPMSLGRVYGLVKRRKP